MGRLSMKKLAKELIEKGLNPRLKWCGFMNPCQVKVKLEEFLPYCNIVQGEMTEDTLFMDINFHEFVLNVKFKFKTNDDNIHFIQEITIE